MKTITSLLLFVVSLGAAPITITTSGFINPIQDGYAFDLVEKPGTANDQTATLWFSQPILSLTAYFTNLPYAVGTGVRLSTNGVFDSEIGKGVLFAGWYTVDSVTPFTSLGLATNVAFGIYIREHGEIRDIRVVAAPEVPEPGTAVLFAAGTFLLAIRLLAKRRKK